MHDITYNPISIDALTTLSIYFSLRLIANYVNQSYCRNSSTTKQSYDTKLQATNLHIILLNQLNSIKLTHIVIS